MLQPQLAQGPFAVQLVLQSCSSLALEHQLDHGGCVQTLRLQ
ncbi:hypothetical protein MGSAQ_000514 [marine sediment metagenome]|uniref:Uncharacterized protein n=1 Tax=marine sediment metagenome TaxID=412755 RepID=A0A1B6NX08_9ZZZZ